MLMPADPSHEKEDPQMNSFQKVLQGVKQLKHKYPSHETAVSEDLKYDDSLDIKDNLFPCGNESLNILSFSLC